MHDGSSFCHKEYFWVCLSFTCFQLGRTTLIQERGDLLARTVFRTEDGTCTSHQDKTVKQVCQICQSVVGPGLAHDCTRSTYNRNIGELVRNSSERTLNRLLHISLKITFKNKGLSLKGDKIKLPRVGSAGRSGLEIMVGTKTHRYIPPRQYSTDNLLKLQIKLSLSDKETL